MMLGREISSEGLPNNDCTNDKLDFRFIHWAGVSRPRPSIFCEPPLPWLDPLIHDFEDYKKYGGFPEIPGYA